MTFLYCTVRQREHTLDREGLSLHFNDGAVVEIVGEQGGVNSGRHEHYSQRWVGTDHITEDDQDKIGLKEKVKSSNWIFMSC